MSSAEYASGENFISQSSVLQVSSKEKIYGKKPAKKRQYKSRAKKPKTVRNQDKGKILFPLEMKIHASLENRRSFIEQIPSILTPVTTVSSSSVSLNFPQTAVLGQSLPSENSVPFQYSSCGQFSTSTSFNPIYTNQPDYDPLCSRNVSAENCFQNTFHPNLQGQILGLKLQNHEEIEQQQHRAPNFTTDDHFSIQQYKPQYQINQVAIEENKIVPLLSFSVVDFIHELLGKLSPTSSDVNTLDHWYLMANNFFAENSSLRIVAASELRVFDVPLWFIPRFFYSQYSSGLVSQTFALTKFTEHQLTPSDALHSFPTFFQKNQKTPLSSSISTGTMKNMNVEFGQKSSNHGLQNPLYVALIAPDAQCIATYSSGVVVISQIQLRFLLRLNALEQPMIKLCYWETLTIQFEKCITRSYLNSCTGMGVENATSSQSAIKPNNRNSESSDTCCNQELIKNDFDRFCSTIPLDMYPMENVESAETQPNFELPTFYNNQENKYFFEKDKNQNQNQNIRNSNNNSHLCHIEMLPSEELNSDQHFQELQESLLSGYSLPTNFMRQLEIAEVWESTRDFVDVSLLLQKSSNFQHTQNLVPVDINQGLGCSLPESQSLRVDNVNYDYSQSKQQENIDLSNYQFCVEKRSPGNFNIQPATSVFHNSSAVGNNSCSQLNRLNYPGYISFSERTSQVFATLPQNATLRKNNFPQGQFLNYRQEQLESGNLTIPFDHNTQVSKTKKRKKTETATKKEPKPKLKRKTLPPKKINQSLAVSETVMNMEICETTAKKKKKVPRRVCGEEPVTRRRYRRKAQVISTEGHDVLKSLNTVDFNTNLREKSFPVSCSQYMNSCG